MQYRSAIDGLPCSRSVETARPISSSEAMPQDMITGFLVCPIRRRSGMSTTSKEATLYKETTSSSKKSTAVGSNGVEKNINPFDSAYSLSFWCHSQGVYAF